MDILDSGQLFTVTKSLGWTPTNTLIIPPVMAASLLLAQVVYYALTRTRALTVFGNEETSTSDSPSLEGIVRHHGGWGRFSLLTIRLIGCLALVSLSAYSLPHCSVTRNATSDKISHCPNAWLTLTYIYSSILGAMSLSTTSWSQYMVSSNTALLLVTLGVYIIRDMWPLATYTLNPQDDHDGTLLWVKIGILFLTAVVIPLYTPRKYESLNIKETTVDINPELTASPLARLFVSHLNAAVKLAARVRHLTVDQMPPLVDSDGSEKLEKSTFNYLDPLLRSDELHIFYQLLKVFRRNIAIMAFCLIGVAVAAFCAPLAIYHIINYLEKGPASDSIRPWFWVALLFTGGVARSLFYYSFMLQSNTFNVQSTSVLTQLIFEHSLRVRATSGDGSVGKVPTPIPSNSPETNESVEADAPADSAEGTETDYSSSAAKVDEESELVKKQKHIYGKITNLITTDINTISFSAQVMFLIVEVPVQVTLAVAFLYRLLGWSSFAGIAVTVLLLPVPGYTMKLLHNVQEKQMELSDARVDKVTEVLNVIRMIKLFGWQERVAEEIEEARKRELRAILKAKALELFLGITNHSIPSVTMVVTYATYTGIMKQQLTPAIIFASLTVFGRLRTQFWNLKTFLGTATRVKVSLDRLNNMLMHMELLDTFSTSTEIDGSREVPTVSSNPNMPVGFNKASFIWSKASADRLQANRFFRLTVVEDLVFKPRCINLINGPTGSGKTAILMALLGEMHYIPDGPDSWVNLPRDGGVAYAAQESWVQNETIRQNIIFDQPYEEGRYKKVIHQCALTADLEMFEAGDQTEVGEKGITLSGGQKARVTLARAVYSSAQTLLLDDIFAALDVHTAQWIVDNCFKGDLIKGRTVLLVTHNLALALPIADQVISIDIAGKITVQDGDNIDKLLLSTAEEIQNEQPDAKESEAKESVVTESGNGKLVVAEEINEGRVSWRAIRLFLDAIAGPYPVLFVILSLLGIFLTEAFFVIPRWFLGYWGSLYEKRDPAEISVTFYLGLYSAIVLTSALIDTASNLFYAFGSMRASEKINSMLIKSVLTSTLRWLDETPVSRIITRCTSDMATVDNSLADGVLTVGVMTVALIVELGVVVVFAPFLALPGLVVGVVAFYIGSLYVKAQRSAQRERSNARAPVIAHITAAISGIVSIRAYSAQEFLKTEARKRIDRNSRVVRLMNGLFRWLGVRVDLLGTSYLTFLALYLVYGKHIGASNSGFTLNIASEFSMLLLSYLMFLNNLEIQANSLERIDGYLNIDHEPTSTPSGVPPAAWPTSGDLRVERLSARYSQSGPRILHDISFHVKSGERIGIVGRTGSGKSSLTLALLRAIITEGTVLFDGRRTDQLNLDILRTNITIIPQTPELMSGTLRKNLDPFDQYDDATLNNALKEVGLYSLQEELGEKKLTLDSDISAGGANVSIGERQIIALARALVRRSKILILDEATSAIDYKTDATIQKTLRHRLPADVTVLTVAHRLQSVMDADKIMVLDNGRIAEYDSPSSLLAKEDGKFKALVDGSGDKDALYEAANL